MFKPMGERVRDLDSQHRPQARPQQTLMAFTSPLFLFAFLPIVLLVFLMLRGERAVERRVWWMLLASCVCYAYVSAIDSMVLAGSVACNYAAARLLARLPSERQRLRKSLLAAAVSGNVMLLMTYKFLAMQTESAYLNTDSILIPLGLSFITFQQIAFVVDCFQRRIQTFSLRDYVLFVTFFPQLVMGPIVQYRQFVPQLCSPALAQWSSQNLVVGFAIFCFGLFKKIVVADSMGPGVDRIFAMSALGHDVGMVNAWAAAIGFQLQLYMDFSGYADMAIGLGRMMNINLPINFDDPFRAVSRFDLWNRWHITFVEFMRQYVFRPLARIRALPMPVALALTGIVSGVWHGLGWTFLVWGLLQTVLLLLSHYWGHWRRRGSGRVLPAWTWLRITITFLASAMIVVLFRAPTLQSAWSLYATMLDIPALLEGARALLLDLPMSQPAPRILGMRDWAALLVCGGVTWMIPSTGALFGKYWTAIDPRASSTVQPSRRVIVPHFQLTPAWGAAVGICMMLTFIFLEHTRRFMYVQF
jgi:D-alanyl-lipoteichoic acid acyltransferase DltB (MBOAT superfamily)